MEPVRLSGYGIGLQPERSQVRFRSRACTSVAGTFPVGGVQEAADWWFTLIDFLKVYILLIFLQRERERDRDKELETSTSCLLHTPYWECACNQGICPWPESNLGHLSPQTDALPLSQTSFGQYFIFVKVIHVLAICSFSLLYFTYKYTSIFNQRLMMCWFQLFTILNIPIWALMYIPSVHTYIHFCWVYTKW